MAIIGNQNPIVGITYDYEISESFNVNDMLVSDIQYVWHLHKKIDGAWMNVTKDKGKIGKKVQYVFYEKVLGIPFRLEVYKAVKNILSNEYEATKLASLEVIPSSASSPKINRVVLFNRGAKDPNKASYQDTLIAQAQCVAMFNKEIEFQLWEDDAAGEGHDKNINKNNTTNNIFKARVNENGIAEVRIPLSSNQNVLKAIANRYLMQGDQNEGANHEYYVTASYAGQIKANQVNVNVANPDHGQKPKDDSFIGSGTSSRPPRHDGKGKIKDAYFVNSKNQKLSKAGIGNFVIVKILTENMKGKVVTLKIWEEDNGLDDLVFEKNIRLNEAESYYRVDITKSVFDKGYGTNRTVFGSPVDSDSVQQTYYIEIIPQDDSVDSKSFGLTSEGLMKVDVAKSPAVVQTSESNVESTCLCKELYKDLIWGEKVSCAFRKKVIQVSADLWGEHRKMEMANGLMAVMNVETGGSFKAHQIMGKSLKDDPSSITKDDFWLTKSDGTKTSRAVGLIQFTQAALELIGEFTSGTGFDKLHEVKLRFAQMGEVNQLDFVKKYFKALTGYSTSNAPEDIYLLVFAPKGVGKGDDYVLYDQAVEAEKYRQNKSVDEENNNDKKIQRNEILGRYDMSFSNGGSNKTETFTCENIQQVEINATDIVHIRIYYNEGLIEKHVPKVIKEEYKNKYKYIYHDKDGNEHEIGIYEHNDKKLVNLDDFNGFSSGGINIAIKIKSGNEDRCYISTINFSALIGALAEIDASDICTTQFSTSDGGSPPPSVSHSNGIAGDLRYLSTNRDGAATYLQHNHFDYTRNVALTNALYKFGFGKAKSMLSEYFDRNGTQTLLPHTVHFRTEKVRHHHHLHLQGLDPNYQEIKE